MKLEDLTSPGIIPNSQKLRNEILKAINYVQVMGDITPDGKVSQATTVAACLQAAIDALTPYKPE